MIITKFIKKHMDLIVNILVFCVIISMFFITLLSIDIYEYTSTNECNYCLILDKLVELDKAK